MAFFLFVWLNSSRLIVKCNISYVFIERRSCKTEFSWKAKSSNGRDAEKSKPDSFYIDKRGKFRSFDHKKLSRKRCTNFGPILTTYYKWFTMYCLNLLIHCFWIGGSLRGRGWKYGSGFVDGIFPVMSPTAEKIMDLVQEEVDKNRIWQVLGSLPASHAIWDDIINVAVQLRLNKQWDQIMWVRNKCLLITFVSSKCFSGKGCLMMRQLIKWDFHIGK